MIPSQIQKTNSLSIFQKICEELKDGVNQVCQTILNDQEVYYAKSFTEGYTAPQVGTFLASFTMHALPTMTCKNLNIIELTMCNNIRR